MWAVERDPVLRSAFLNITLLDRPPDLPRLRRRMGEAIDGFPRMRQRVDPAPAPWDRPGWVDDESFDIDYHIRCVALPAGSTMRQLLDLAGMWLQDAFDPVRPLWQLTVVEGLPGGGAALIVKMHHTITDGVGGLRLSSSFLDLDREGHHPVRLPAAPTDEGSSGPPWRRVAAVVGAAIDAMDPRRAPGRLGAAAGATRSLIRQVAVTDKPGSPLWAGKSSMRRRLDTVDLSLTAVKAAGRAAGGTVNDVFVAGVVTAAADYHRRMGAPARRFRVSVPISTRQDSSFGGNAFVPARVVVPVTEDPRAQVDAVRQAVSRVRGEPAMDAVGGFATVAAGLPPALLTPFARSQAATVDLAASNLRGSPVDLFVAGASVLANYPMGPTAGVAFNATVLSYNERLDMGLVSDPAAVTEPETLRACVVEAFAALTGP